MATMGSGAQPPAQPGVPSGRPGWLTFFAVTAIVLGGLMLTTVAGELGSEKLMKVQSAFMQDRAGPNPLRDVQLDMQAKMTVAMREGSGLLKALAPLGALTALGLIVGGIGCMQLRRRARPLLLAAFALGLIYEGARAKPVLERQLAVTKVTQTSMAQMVEAMGKRTAPVDGPARQAQGRARGPSSQTVQQVMGTAMNLATLAGMATALAMVVLKLTFLIAGLAYLTRPRVRALFG
jgi:hypothetical protein